MACQKTAKNAILSGNALQPVILTGWRALPLAASVAQI
jgi:hypothetical protein